MRPLRDQMKVMYQSNTKVNEMSETFKDSLLSSIDKHIPHRRSKPKDSYPWIGPDLKKLINKQHRAYKIKKKTGDPQHVQQYINIKHQVQKKSRKAYWNYIEDVVTPREEDRPYAGMKRFWTYVKHKTKVNVGVSSLKSKGKLFSHPVDKAELLNYQFQSAFSSRVEVTEAEFIRSG